jgi:hypothetical protein
MYRPIGASTVSLGINVWISQPDETTLMVIVPNAERWNLREQSAISATGARTALLASGIWLLASCMRLTACRAGVTVLPMR